MKRTLLIFVAVLALLITTLGCDQGNTEDGNKVDPYIGGTSGLSVQFGDDAPPAEIFDKGQYPFDIDVKLLNVGETDILKENVKIVITGLNPTDFGKPESFFIKQGISEDVLATYKDFEGNIINPSEVFVTFPGLTFRPTLTGNFDAKIRADICYGYKTEAITYGCIRKDVLSTSTTAICQVNEEKTVYNSGAPIQVTKFEEVPSGSDKIRYLFTISHVGSGDIYAPGTMCPTDRTLKNKVHFKIESSVTDLECVGLVDGTGKEGDILLRDGEQTIRCLQQTSSQLDFEDRIKITLTYDYAQYIDTQMLVKKSN